MSLWRPHAKSAAAADSEAAIPCDPRPERRRAAASDIYSVPKKVARIPNRRKRRQGDR